MRDKRNKRKNRKKARDNLPTIMSDQDVVPRYKIVVVGDGAAGKTSLLQRFAENTFSADYTPTIFENRAKHLEVK